jgi:hypothetical protein
MPEFFYLIFISFVLWFLTSSLLLYRIWRHNPQWAKMNHLQRSLAERDKTFRWLCWTALLNRELRQFAGALTYANFAFQGTWMIGFVVYIILMVHRYPVKIS